MRPHFASSQIAASSFAIRRHHAVLSGMLEGTTVPNHREKLSGALGNALPNLRRAFCAKNEAFLMAKSRFQNVHIEERRNHAWMHNARGRTSF